MTAPATSHAGVRRDFDEPLARLAESLRDQVTYELARLEPAAREPLRGDYLFIIDEAPRFVVVIQKARVQSGLFELEREGSASPGAPSAARHVAWLEGRDPQREDAPECVTLEDVSQSARASIRTDRATLARLLSGTMKAKAAFLAGKVRIDGDLPGFLRLIGLLKSRGIRPPGATPIESGGEVSRAVSPSSVGS